MFPPTDSTKNAVNMFPRTGRYKWLQFYQPKPCWVYGYTLYQVSLQ